jgi:recombination protein RecT
VAFLNNEHVLHEVQRALPAHVPIDFFMRCAQTSLLNNPNLARADKGSLLRELVAIAQLGLVTDPQMGEAWLIIDSKGQVQRRVGYQGLRRLALQSGEVTALNAQIVYQNDVCEIHLGDAPRVHHVIDVKNPGGRGPVVGCYAVGSLKGSSTPVVEWMSWSDIEKHRSRYSEAFKRNSGPWADDLAQYEMGRKTVFRRLAKWLPKSPLLADALAHEDRQDMRDITPETMALPTPEAEPAPADPMDRVVAEQRANGGPAAEPEPAKPRAVAIVWRDKTYEKRPGFARNAAITAINEASTADELERLESEVTALTKSLVAAGHSELSGQVLQAWSKAVQGFEPPEPPFEQPYDQEAEELAVAGGRSAQEEWLAAAETKIKGAPTLGHLAAYARQLREEAEPYEEFIKDRLEAAITDQDRMLPK